MGMEGLAINPTIVVVTTVMRIEGPDIDDEAGKAMAQASQVKAMMMTGNLVAAKTTSMTFTVLSMCGRILQLHAELFPTATGSRS